MIDGVPPERGARSGGDAGGATAVRLAGGAAVDRDSPVVVDQDNVELMTAQLKQQLSALLAATQARRAILDEAVAADGLADRGGETADAPSASTPRNRYVTEVERAGHQ